MTALLQIFSSAGYHVALYDNVASQIPAALSSIEAQLCDMEAKGLMRSKNVTAKEAFQLVVSVDDLQTAVDGALYIQVRSSILCIHRSFHLLNGESWWFSGHQPYLPPL